MRILRHPKLMVFTLLVAAGCNSAESTLEFASKVPLFQGMFPACKADVKKRLKRVNWRNARTIGVRIRQGEFSLMAIGLTKDKPYILRIRNADDKSRNFKAGKFFRSVALSRVAINGKGGKARRNFVFGLAPTPPSSAIVRTGDRRWTGFSPTRSGPEGSSRNEFLLGLLSGLPPQSFSATSG